jgi:hypothetical protein
MERVQLISKSPVAMCRWIDVRSLQKPIQSPRPHCHFLRIYIIYVTSQRELYSSSFYLRHISYLKFIRIVAACRLHAQFVTQTIIYLLNMEVSCLVILPHYNVRILLKALFSCSLRACKKLPTFLQT